MNSNQLIDPPYCNSSAEAPYNIQSYQKSMKILSTGRASSKVQQPKAETPLGLIEVKIIGCSPLRGLEIGKLKHVRYQLKKS